MQSLQPSATADDHSGTTSQSKMISGVEPKVSKSRNGCQRCKARRVKCDETKPVCKQCTDKGVACTGYVRSFKWSSKYEVFKSPERKSKTRNDTVASLMRFTSPRRYSTDTVTSQTVARAVSLSGIDPVIVDSSFDVALDALGCYLPPDPSSRNKLISLDEIEVAEQDFEHIHTQRVDAALQDISPAFTKPIEARASIPSLADISASEDSREKLYAKPKAQHKDTSTSLDDGMQTVAGHVRLVTQTKRRPPSSSSHAPENLLRWFYRISPPQYSDTDLVEHYFSRVCKLYALFDSAANPFRTLVGQNWSNSRSISLAIQSMACAHLANTNSTMAKLGLEKQRQAALSVQTDLALMKAGSISTDRILLAVLLLGPTASWHNAGDTGLNYLDIARDLIGTKLSQSKAHTDGQSQRLEQFFMHAMIYWEMMASFVDSRTTDSHTDANALEETFQAFTLNPTDDYSIARKTTIMPHPWTGIAPHVQMLFAELGRIMRGRVTGQGLIARNAREEWVLAIEQALLAAEIPTCEQVSNYEDENTPRADFVQLAEAYRCAGLLQIYHVFPEAVAKRFPDGSGNPDGTPQANEKFLGTWRTNLALHTLKLVERLPISSGTSCLHPILVMIAGCELKFPSVWPSAGAAVQPTYETIAAARDFAETRLSDLAKRLPEKPFLRMIGIMKEVWLQIDLLDLDVYWMEVMYEKGWETIMG